MAIGEAAGQQRSTTTLLLLLLLPLSACTRSTSRIRRRSGSRPGRSSRSELQDEIICMCGTCGRKRIGECTCGLAAQMRAEVAQMVAQGRSREQIYEFYMAKYGSQEPLASPIDKGFNRLAWLFPYLIGGSGAVVLGDRRVPLVAARRAVRRDRVRGFRRRRSQMQQRLDDELRDLD